MLHNVPEIIELVGSADANRVLQINGLEGEVKTKSILCSVFTKLMSASQEEIFKATSEMKIRLHSESQVC